MEENSPESLYGRFYADFARMVEAKLPEQIQGKDVEDFVQDAFLKFIEKMKEGTPPNPEGWLRDTADKEIKNAWRKKQVEKRKLLMTFVDGVVRDAKKKYLADVDTDEKTRAKRQWKNDGFLGESKLTFLDTACYVVETLQIDPPSELKHYYQAGRETGWEEAAHLTALRISARTLAHKHAEFKEWLQRTALCQSRLEFDVDSVVASFGGYEDADGEWLRSFKPHLFVACLIGDLSTQRFNKLWPLLIEMKYAEAAQDIRSHLRKHSSQRNVLMPLVVALERLEKILQRPECPWMTHPDNNLPDNAAMINRAIVIAQVEARLIQQGVLEDDEKRLNWDSFKLKLLTYTKEIEYRWDDEKGLVVTHPGGEVSYFGKKAT